MSVKGASLGLLIVVTVLSSCGGQAQTRSGATPTSREWCISSGQAVDSSFAVEQARRAVSQPGLTLKVDAIQVIRGQSGELGLIISLVAAQPPVVGGGGLVWVDLETGCPIVLRRYE